mgnify:FL=1
MAGIWDKVTTITTPLWTSISKITVPTGDNTDDLFWSPVTILNSITYKESSGTTPSIDLVNAWNLIDDEWEHFNYDYEDLII